MRQLADSVLANEVPDNTNCVTMEKGQIAISHKNELAENLVLREKIFLVDKQADDKTRQLYCYLVAMGQSSRVMYGHQNDLWHKAGSKSLSFSDTKDVVGDYPAVLGMDVLSLLGNEFSAERYNKDYAGKQDISDERIDIEKLGVAYANVLAGAKITNYAMRSGCIVSLSAHMPNFTQVEEIDEGKNYPQAYARYEFAPYTPNVLEGNVVRSILKGGEYHSRFLAYLDVIADFAKLLDGPIMFRPFHENTGSWFWWGEAHCTPEEFKELFQFTVCYLKDTKQVHNLLYVYSPGSEPKTIEEFEIRYPGDDYVDMVGFDMYDWQVDLDREEEFWTGFQAQIALLENFSQKHDKLMAVTETGLATPKPDEGDKMTAVHRTGNKNKNWYINVLDAVAKSNASYFLLWANFGKHSSFYSPYVDLIGEKQEVYGHELLDAFINYYNDKRSIFANMHQSVVQTFLYEK